MFASRPGKAPTAAAKNAFNSIHAARLATPSFARRMSSSAQAGTESLRIPDSGRPLDAGERREFEPRFGFSFADVRVHDGAQAANVAKAVGARAFTLGNHIVFGAGAHASGSAEGRATLAHELAHVVQHGGTPAQRASTISSPADAGEREAEAIAAKVRAAESGALAIRARISPSVLHRQSVHMASGRFVGDKGGAENNQKDEVISVLDTLAELGAISPANYEADYKAVNALPPPPAITPALIPNAIAGIKAAEEPTLDAGSARKKLSVNLKDSVGKGQQNNKGDILLIQGQLLAEWHLSVGDYNNEHKAVNASSDATITDSTIPKTLEGIGRQKLAILGGQTGPKYRHQLGLTLEMARLEAQHAQATWTQSKPGSMDTFDTWVMAKNEQAAGPLPPVAPSTKLNCWEMVLLTALRAGVTTWQWVHDVYSKAGKSADYTKSLVDALSRGARTPYDWHTRQGQVSNTPRPNLGQVVFFDGVSHVALATGQTKTTQQTGRPGSEVLSFWPMGAEKETLESVTKPTIEELAQGMSKDHEIKVEFSQPPW